MSLLLWLKRLFIKEKIKSTSMMPTGFAPPWSVVANKEIGIKEYVKGSNPRILEYHSVTKLKATDDQIPWCSAFVCWCLEKSGYLSPRSAWARSFLNWGLKLDIPRYGCICVFKRNETSGHVGFYISEYPGHILVLGGNQSDAVCVMPYKKADLLSYRWPIAEYDKGN